MFVLGASRAAKEALDLFEDLTDDETSDNEALKNRYKRKLRNDGLISVMGWSDSIKAFLFESWERYGRLLVLTDLKAIDYEVDG